MPAIWASSERPLFVRTVWVDGMRHAVLSPDDPVANPRLPRRHPRPTMEKSFPVETQQPETRLDRLSSCFMNLHVVVEKNFPDSKIPPKIVRRQSAPPCTRICDEKAASVLKVYVNDKVDEDRVSYRILDGERESFPPSESLDYSVGRSFHLRRDAFSAMTECKSTDRSPDWNPLSERVLQWLDLSGRAQDYELESPESREEARTREDRRWSATRRRRHLSRPREDSAFAERDRVVVQNYNLQKSFKLECEAKFSRRRLSRTKDKTEEDESVTEESSGSKGRAVRAREDYLENEDESRDENRSAASWTPPGRLQLHIVMPSFNSVEKRTSSLESLACD
ncbi:hypothetical protein PUN28_013310 [Cardiocondyla obscurior]|uniref:Uncharacterized protein n=1 Tax=Cardiocondyla obscurior TaxID=286306 RepID=A0AAW2FDE9_9HYME